MPDYDILARLNTSLNYRLNDHRIEKIITASTLNEASKMGFLDSIRDWFHHGIKRETITGLYQQLAMPDQNQLYEHQTVKIAHRFNRLREMAHDSCQPYFAIDIFQNSEKQGQWSYTLNIDEHHIYQSEPMDYSHENQFSTFCALKCAMDFNNSLYQYRSELSLDKLIQGRLACMADDKNTQRYLTEHLDDARYSRKNFCGYEVNADDKNQLIVKFQQDSLLVSNRAATTYEFRGQRLKDALKTSSFNNLRALLSDGHMTQKDDTLLRLAASPKKELRTMIGDEGMHASEVRSVAWNNKAGETTLGALWSLTPPLAPAHNSDIIAMFIAQTSAG